MKKVASILAAFLVFFAILAIPIDPALLAPEAKSVAAVTILMILLWVTGAIPLEATALLPLILFPVLGVLSPAEVAASYGDQVIFLFLGGFIIAMAMQRWGLHRRIALHIIRVTGTSPRRLVLGFMVATARSEEHTSELQSRPHLVCRLLLEKKKKLESSRKHLS